MEQNADRMGFSLILISVVAMVMLIFNLSFGPTVRGFFSGMKSKVDQTSQVINSDAVDVAPSFANGGDISAWSTSPSEILSDVKSMNLNSVSIPVRVNIPDITSTTATVDSKSLTYATSIATLMRDNHINAIVEPYPYINSGTQTEVDLNPSDKSMFMQNWSNAVESIAQTFEPYTNVTGLYIGSNFVHLEDQTDAFDHLISQLRPIFKGQLIYRTNWWYSASWDATSSDAFEKKKETPLFKNVDVLSIASYFEVTNDADIMKVSDLKPALNNTSKNSRGQKVIDQIKELHEATGKPITFGELGITNYVGAMSQPYQYLWPAGSAVNDNIQSVWYQSWIETMKQYDWFKGYYLFGVGDSSSVYYPNNKAKSTIKNLTN